MGFLAFLLLVALLILFYRQSGSSAKDEQRLKLLEAKVQWLYRESQSLRAELAVLKGEAPPVPEADLMETPPALPPVEEAAPKPRPGQRPPPGAKAPEPLEPAPAAWWQRLLAGNPLAKIGVVLLFFGVASALRLAADYGFLPVPLRLLLGAVGGVAMIAFGWAKARQAGHQAFGIAVQGGGFAILYLIVYFMLARYGMLGPAAAFGLFAFLGLACVALAAAQDGMVLAVFGLAGAFLAPVLANRASADPSPLFGYFTLLNLLIVGVSWFKAWRALNVAGFLMTLGVGMAWAVEHYHLGHHRTTQGFLLFFWLLYSATPVAMAGLRAPGRSGWSDAALIFGTPLVGFALQSQLAGDRYELAWAAFFAALYYGALWGLVFFRRDEEMALLERSQLALAIAFGTLAVPLAFGVQVTAAFWALEGVAVLWYGVVRNRPPALAFGALLQAAAGAWFLHGLPEMAKLPPLLNDVFLGMLLLAGAGYASARLLRDARAVPALVWSLGWGMAAVLWEIDRHLPQASGTVLSLAFLAAVLGAMVWQGRHWPAARQAATLPAMVLLAWQVWSNLTQPGTASGLPYLPVLNAFDIAQLAGLAALHSWQRRVAAGGAFLWVSALAARIAHHWGGVPFAPISLWHSTLVQAMLTLLWALLAIAAMIRAARVGRRSLWQGGFALLAVVGAKLMLVDLANAGTLLWTGSLIGVALLVLAAGYFAPAPPKPSGSRPP